MVLGKTATVADADARNALSVAEGEGEVDAAAGGLGLVPEEEHVGVADVGAPLLWLGL